MTSSSIRCITKPDMTDALKARDAKDVEDAVRWALAEAKTLEVAGRGTKRALGRPSQSDLTLDISGLSGVMLYDPVVKALPGLALGFVVAGGVLYSFGVIFHAWQRLRFQNAIWHGFVLLGAACHYTAILDVVLA